MAVLVLGLLHKRRQIRKIQAKDQETEIAMRKLGPESETSSVAGGFGDLRAVTNLEDDGAEGARGSENASGSWRRWDVASKTPGWWRM